MMFSLGEISFKMLKDVACIGYGEPSFDLGFILAG